MYTLDTFKSSEYTTKTYNADKAFGDRGGGYIVPSKVSAIQSEIMNYGPVEAAFRVYSDFPTYKSGVYKHMSGKEIGGHAIKIIGWGTEGKGWKYWSSLAKRILVITYRVA